MYPLVVPEILIIWEEYEKNDKGLRKKRFFIYETIIKNLN